MIKVVTPAYVFKFVGGENKLTPACRLNRRCHYCRKPKKGGMICVYSNTSIDDGPTLYVCPLCAVKGCTESEIQWEAMKDSMKKLSKKERVDRE